MVEMLDTLINGRWSLKLPEHRARRAEWSGVGWEPERLASMHDELGRLVEHYAGLPINGNATEIPTDYPRPVIIDVGVEEGDLTALWSLWGCDVMVEPNPRVWPNVRAIWQANDLRPPLRWWVGFAADHDDPMPMDPMFGTSAPALFAAPDGWPECAHGPVIGDHAFLHLSQHAGQVPTAKLDTLAHGHRIDAITMDTEGSELTVLRGAERILREDRPLVWVSVHSDQQWMDENYPMDKRDDVLEFMAGLGYQAEWLAQDHEEHWLFRPVERDPAAQ